MTVMKMYVYIDSVVHYTCHVNKILTDQTHSIHPEPRPTPESLEDCGWVLKCFRVGQKKCLMTNSKVGYFCIWHLSWLLRIIAMNTPPPAPPPQLIYQWILIQIYIYNLTVH